MVRVVIVGGCVLVVWGLISAWRERRLHRRSDWYGEGNTR